MSGASGRCAPADTHDRIASMTTSALIASSVWSRLLLAVSINAVVWLAVAWALDWFGAIAW
jgi:hypothetical protein